MTLEVDEELVVELDDEDFELPLRLCVFGVLGWTVECRLISTVFWGQQQQLCVRWCSVWIVLTVELWKELVEECEGVGLVLLINEALVYRFASGMACRGGVCVVVKMYVDGKRAVIGLV
eukprot:344179-Amphidinium_carterae.2